MLEIPGKTNLSALLRSFEQDKVGGRTQVWQNSSEVQISPLRCIGVSVRTRQAASQPFSAFQSVGLRQTMASG